MLLLLSVTAETAVQRPDNIAALAGATVVFKCTSEAKNQTRCRKTVYNIISASDLTIASHFSISGSVCRLSVCHNRLSSGSRCHLADILASQPFLFTNHARWNRQEQSGTLPREIIDSARM